MKLRKKEKSFILLCLFPAVALTIFFMIIPLCRGLGLSFMNISATSMDGEFIGLENYAYLLQDEDFYQALLNTLKLLFFVPLFINLFALFFAFFVTQTKLKESNFYRFLFFFPSIISATALGILWTNIYSPTMGIAKKLFEFLGLEELSKIAILGDSKTVLLAVGIVMVWQSIGYYMVMYIAAIDGIDGSVYEAATLDGCGIIKKMVYVTVPLLKNMIGITFILSLSSVIGMSYLITSIMTAGGPAGSSTVLLYYMYSQAFELSNFGYAMSIAVVTLILAFVLSHFSRKLSSK